MLLFVLVVLTSVVFQAHSPMQNMQKDVAKEVTRQHEERAMETWRGEVLDGLCEEYALTARERDVVRLMLRGRSAGGIADILVISVTTVKTHIAHIYQKLDVHSKEEFLDFVEQFGDAHIDKSDSLRNG